MKPVFVEPEEEDDKRVKFEENSSMGKQSIKESVASEDLFADGIDNILFQGELMKFKPGISSNFISRYV